MLILVEVSRVCYLNNSGEGICGLYDEPTQMRSSLIGKEHLRWFTFVGLALPLILVAFMNGIPWAAVVASQTATAAFMCRTPCTSTRRPSCLASSPPRSST